MRADVVFTLFIATSFADGVRQDLLQSPLNSLDSSVKGRCTRK